MKSILLILTFSFTVITLTQAQKAKFKNIIVTVQTAKLPIHYSDVNNRNYNVTTRGIHSGGIDPFAKKLYGWTVDATNARIKAVVNLYSFKVAPAKKTSQKNCTTGIICL